MEMSDWLDIEKMIRKSGAPGPGKMLLAEPFMYDPNFKRSVILLCEHAETGSLGFILNKELTLTLSDVITGVGHFNAPLFYGGPVEPDTLHFVHDMGPDRMEGAHEVVDGIYWGGNFEKLKKMMVKDQLSDVSIRFFLGYSGWQYGQLENEFQSNSWFVDQVTHNNVFTHFPTSLWKDMMEAKGENYRLVSQFPEDPTLN